MQCTRSRCRAGQHASVGSHYRPIINCQLDPKGEEAIILYTHMHFITNKFNLYHSDCILYFARGTHPGCGRTPGGSKPGPSFSGGCMPPCIGRFHLLSNLDATNRPWSTIKREALPPFQHTLTCIFSLD